MQPIGGNNGGVDGNSSPPSRQEQYVNVSRTDPAVQASVQPIMGYPMISVIVDLFNPQGAKKPIGKFKVSGNMPLDKFLCGVKVQALAIKAIGPKDKLTVIVESGHGVTNQSTMEILHQRFKDEDGFLRITVTKSDDIYLA